jgi:hypothetical protein
MNKKRETKSFMDEYYKISDDVKVKIVHDIIEPYYVDDIKSIMRSKKCYRLTGQIFETVSKILVAVGGILSFSSGYFNDPILSFLAGSISTLSLTTLQFASFAYAENKKQSKDLNTLLTKLHIDSVPVLDINGKSEIVSGTIPGRKGSFNNDDVIVSEFKEPTQ